MKIRCIIVILALVSSMLIGFTGATPTTDTDSITVNAIDISGDITDNYANLSYGIEFTNQQATDDEVELTLSVSDNLYLSNFSLQLENISYWGEVKAIQTARDEYQNATESNKTAVLVEHLHDGYYVRFNLNSSETGMLTFYFEGYIKRALGSYDFKLYDLELNDAITEAVDPTMNIDIDIQSSQTELQYARAAGLPVKRSKISDHHYQMDYESQTLTYSQISLRYAYFTTGIHNQLLTYTNGTDHFFAYQFAPEVYVEDEVVSREYIFVLDRSGSMSGVRLDNAKTALKSLLNTLDDSDVFNVISFAASTSYYAEETVAGNSDNIAQASNWIDAQDAGGSTNIDTALTTAFDDLSSSDNAKAVVFLSDGKPTAGEVDPEVIVSNAAERNTEEATVFSVSLGTATSEDMMATLAYHTGGEFLVIGDDDTVDEKLKLFYEEFRYPVGTGLSITYDGILGDPYPTISQLSSTLFNGTEIIQTGRYDGEALSVNSQVSTPSKLINVTASTGTSNTDLHHLETLWAINQINALVRSDPMHTNATISESIVNLAVQYQLVVEGYTGIIIVVDQIEESPESTTSQDGYASVTQTQQTQQPGRDNAAPAQDPPYNEALATEEASYTAISLLITGMGAMMILRNRQTNDKNYL